LPAHLTTKPWCKTPPLALDLSPDFDNRVRTIDADMAEHGFSSRSVVADSAAGAQSIDEDE
jgi:hypothetical protein